MKTLKAYLLAIAYASLVFLGGNIIINDMNMQERLVPLEKQFEAVLMDHLKNHTPFAGRIDSIITARNEILRNEKYLWVGSWSTGNDGANAIYLKATWLSDRLYRYAWRTAAFGPQNFGDAVIVVFIYLCPVLAYFGALAWTVYLTIMLFGKVTKRYVPW